MTPRQSATLQKMLAEYNNRPGQSPDNVPLTLDEFTVMELAALVDAHADRLCPNDVPTGDWLQRWTPAEQEAAFSLAAQAPQIKALWLELLQHATVQLDDARLVAGVPQLCANIAQYFPGVIAPEQAANRAAEIMAY